MRQQHVGQARSTDDSLSLASWETSLGGTDWLDDLAADGRAVKLSSDGYPNRYVVAAGTLVSVLESGPPKYDGPPVIGDDYYFLPAGRVGEARIDIERVRSLEPDELLLVEAWDQS